MTESTRLTNSEIAILYKDGVKGLIANAGRNAKLKAIREWEANESKKEKLDYLRESPLDMTHIDFELRNAWGEGEPELHPSSEVENIPDGMVPPDMKSIPRELAGDVFENFCEEIRRLQEDSNLSKNQFLVYFLRWNKKSERVVADLLDMEIGTVRSHYGRAKQKFEDAENTMRVRDYCEVGDWTEFGQEAGRLLDEAASS